eukprot:TRINITY_DN58403_c0_g1_i1.p1 TRINITY_DN58403_c0_g1~~TRINITY_DN58403_c0_g1_i1.p1  ORF type:complete len:295 (+),score=61.65 TRINITY_DN58403_c0_g1_i1:152-1036(+)
MSDSLVHAIAGGLASLLSLFLLYPINQVRVLLQSGARPAAGAVPPQGTGCQTLAVLRCVVRERGVAALYDGVIPVLVVTGISNAVFFALYRGLSGFLIWRTAAASILSAICTCPLWVAATRLQLLPGGKDSSSLPPRTPLGLLLLVLRIAREEGARGLWAGLSASLWLCSVPIIQYWVYDVLRGLTVEAAEAAGAEEGADESARRPSAPLALLLGALAKLASAFAGHPLQVAQVRQRVSPGPMPKVLLALLRSDGPRALFVGLESKLLLTALNGAFMMCFYEQLVAVVGARLGA